MAKEVILYNLAPEISDEEYFQYVKEKKGPFLNGLPSVKSFSLIRIAASKKGDIPYKYVGIVDLTSMDDWVKDTASTEFEGFLKEWIPKTAEFHILFGEEIDY